MPSSTSEEEHSSQLRTPSRALLADNRRQATVLPGDVANQRQLWGTLWTRRGSILGVAAACVVLFATYTLLDGIKFESQGQLYLGEITATPPSQTQTPSGDFGLNEAVQGLVASEMEILQSVSLVRRAVLESGVNATIKRTGTWYLPYWKYLVTGRNIDTVDAILNVVRPTNTELPHNTKSPQTFTVVFSSPSEYDVLDTEHGTNLGHAVIGKPFHSPRLTLTLEPGPSGPPAAGSRYDVEVAPLDKVIERIPSNLKITVPKQTSATADVNVVTLDYSNASPKVAAAFLDRLMTDYLETRQAWKTEDASAAEAFVTTQLGGIRQSLAQVESKLADYRRTNPSVVLNDESKALVEEIGKYEELRAKTQLDAAAFAQIKRAVDAKDPPMGAFLIGETVDPVLENMAEQLASARQRLADYKTKYNDAAPEIKQQEGRVGDQLDAIRTYVTSRDRRAQATLQTLGSIIAGYDNKLRTVPAAELGLAQLQRESEVYSKTYSYLLERQQDAAIFKASTLSKNHILYAPEVPIRVSSPNLLLRSLSVGVGLFLGALAVLGRTIFGRSFQTVEDVKRSVVGVPVFGAMAQAEGLRKASRPGSVDASLDVTVQAHTSRFAESLRSLRVSVLAWSSAGGAIVALVTSPQKGDGKTTLTMALAGALSASMKRVLVIDADLRRPTPNSAARTSGGLSSVLRGTSDWRRSLTHVELAEGFQLLPAGGPDAPEALTVKALSALIDDVRKNFDFVLIDSPSFPMASDSLVLARLADVTFSVVRVRRTPRVLTGEHLNGMLAHTQDLALIVNDAPIASDQSRPPKRKKRPAEVAASQEERPEWSSGAPSASWAFRGVNPAGSGPKRP